MPATWPPPTIGICMHCGSSIVRSGKVTVEASGAGPAEFDAWMDKSTNPVCVPPTVLHTPIPAGHGLRGEAR